MSYWHINDPSGSVWGVEADRVDFRDGVAVFSNGHIFEPEIKVAIAAGRWVSISPGERAEDDE